MASPLVTAACTHALQAVHGAPLTRPVLETALETAFTQLELPVPTGGWHDQVFANFAKSGRVSIDDFFEIVGQFRAHYGKKDGKNVRPSPGVSRVDPPRPESSDAFDLAEFCQRYVRPGPIDAEELERALP